MDMAFEHMPLSVGSAELPEYDPWTSHGFDAYASDDEGEPPPPLAPLQADDAAWLCSRCDSPDWRRIDTGYRCCACGGTSFYEQTLESPTGSWIFVPSKESTGTLRGETPSGTTTMSRATHLPDGYSEHEPNSERAAESERPTGDPCVDPDTMSILSRGGRRRARRGGRRRGDNRAGGPKPDGNAKVPPGDKRARGPGTDGHGKVSSRRFWTRWKF